MDSKTTRCTDKELAIYCGLLVDALVDYFCLSPKRDVGITTDEFEEVKKDLLEVRDKYYNAINENREKSRRLLTLRGQFESAMEQFVWGDESKDEYLSDLGDGAELIRSFDVDLSEEQRKAYDRAYQKVKYHSPKSLLAFINLVKNNGQREDTICDIIWGRMLLENKSKQRTAPVKSKKPTNGKRRKYISAEKLKKC